MSTLVREVSKSEQDYTWLRSRIASHAYGPGYRLVLSGIARELQMSVVPVREAIRRLEAEGYVTFERNVGAYVSLIDEDQYAHTMQALGLVEGSATALSAPLLDHDALARAEQINDQMRALLDHFDAHRFTQLNQQFHAVLFEPCPNPHILDLVHRGWARLSGIRDTTFAYVPGRARHSVEEHEQILQLIRDGAEPLEIELSARSHRWRTRDAFLAARHSHTSEEGR